MGIHFLFLLYFLTMKYLSFIFALAILSAPLAAETLTAATLNAFDAADSSDDSMDADAGDEDGPNANLITSADWLAGRNPLFTDAVITEILSVSIADTSATVDALVTALNTIVEELYQCVTEAHAAASACLCGGDATVIWDETNYADDATACDTEVPVASITTFNRWLDSRKLGTTGTLPGLDDDEITALFAAGSWTTAPCYTTLGTDGVTPLGYAGCTNEYALIRGLWDSSVVPAATLTSGGLTATFIPTLLAAYE